MPSESAFPRKATEGQTHLTFAMKHWEKTKKDPRRVEEPTHFQTAHDHKKKKLKPVEKVKYRLRSVPEEEEE